MTRMLKSLLASLASHVWLDEEGSRRLHDEIESMLNEGALSPRLGALFRPELAATYRAHFGHDYLEPRWIRDLTLQLENNVHWAEEERLRVAHKLPEIPPAEYPPGRFGATERSATGAQILSYLQRISSDLPHDLTAAAIDEMIARVGINAGGTKKLAETVVADWRKMRARQPR